MFLESCGETAVAANPSVLGRLMVPDQRQKLRYADWIQTFKIGTLYRSIEMKDMKL